MIIVSNCSDSGLASEGVIFTRIYFLKHCIGNEIVFGLGAIYSLMPQKREYVCICTYLGM